jgi:putative transposase
MLSQLPQRKSPRLQGYDYTQAGAYFVTICTHDRQLLFGHINDLGEMHRNVAGDIATQYWLSIPHHFPLVELDVFVVMPNPVHGILVFGGHGSAVSLPPHSTIESFAKPVAGSLSTVMRSYKSIVTRKIRAATNTRMTIWQGRFYDHVICNDADLNRVREYTINNPARWREDRFYTG